MRRAQLLIILFKRHPIIPLIRIVELRGRAQAESAKRLAFGERTTRIPISYLSFCSPRMVDNEPDGKDGHQKH